VDWIQIGIANLFLSVQRLEYNTRHALCSVLYTQ